MRGRAILTKPGSGAWNLALDEAILRLAEKDQVTLRVSAWKPATVCIGVSQRHDELPADLLDRHPIVRGAFPGRGWLLHGERDLSVSLFVPRAAAPSREEIVSVISAIVRAANDPLPDDGPGAKGIWKVPDELVRGASVKEPERQASATLRRRQGIWLLQAVLPVSGADAGSEEASVRALLARFAVVYSPAAEVELEEPRPDEVELADRLTAGRFATDRWIRRR